MQFRRMLALLTFVIAFASQLAFAQAPEGIDKVIADVKAKAKAVEAFGQAAAKGLRKAGKAHDKVALPLRELRALAKASANAGPNTDEDAKAAENIEAACEELAKALEALQAFDVAGSAAMHAAAQGETSVFAKTAIDRVDVSFYVPTALKAVRKFIDLKGTYLGMFADLAKDRERYLEAFFVIFLDANLKPAERQYAADGIAEMGVKGDKPTLDRLRAIVNDKDETDEMKANAGKAMARLGDMMYYEELLNELKKRWESETKKERPNNQMIWTLRRNFATFYQDIYDFKATTMYYLDALAMVLPMETKSMSEQLRQLIAGDAYNLACSMSRLGLFDDALWALDMHFNFGGDNYDWALQDGDLKSLRDGKGEAFQALVKSYRGAKEKKGTWKFSGADFAKHVEGVSPEAAKEYKKAFEAMEAAASQPASQPAK